MSIIISFYKNIKFCSLIAIFYIYEDVTYQVILEKLNNGEYISLDSVDKLLEYENAVTIKLSKFDKI